MEIKPFNILDKDCSLNSHLMIEASAGTGKTFTIENIVVRLLLEGEEPLAIEQILAVTFTRLATRDLKLRIRAAIEKTLRGFEGQEDSLPDYAENLTNIAEGKRRLERALLAFNEAQIFTIHSFCSKMLKEFGFEAQVRMDVPEVEPNQIRAQQVRIVHDFLRTKVQPGTMAKAHLNYLLKKFPDMEALEKEFLVRIESKMEMEEPPDFLQLHHEFIKRVKALKTVHGITPKGILSDFYKIAPCYDGMMRKIKPEVVCSMEKFSALFEPEEISREAFDTLIGEGLYWCALFEEKYRKKELPSDLLYPEFSALLRTLLLPLVQENGGLIRLSYEFQQFAKARMEKEELFGFDDILLRMLQALQKPEFLLAVRARFKAVIVDEFQDTDPVQWEIFNTVFPPSEKGWGRLFLVGDPKQSIYAFRQADIYTYLNAAAAIGNDHIVSLNTNYRSVPALVENLNCLFSAAARWMPLPRSKTYLPVPPVHHAVQDKPFNDNRGALHFYCSEAGKDAEERHFLPFMVQEIQRLHSLEGLPYQQFAVLVADRLQAQRVQTFFNAWGIPTVLHKTQPITETEAYTVLLELLHGIAHFRDEGAIKTALGGPLFGWTHAEVLQLEDSTRYEEVLFRFRQLAQLWSDEGPAACFNAIFSDATERLLPQEEGDALLTDLQQLIDLLLEQQKGRKITLRQAIEWLEDVKNTADSEDKAILKRNDPNKGAVKVLTMHGSKGLEFGVVFALGLIVGYKTRNEWYPVLKEGKMRLRFCTDPESADYQLHLEELKAEKMRLLYVALTRAKYRMYCPLGIRLENAPPITIFFSYLAPEPAEIYSLLDRLSISYTRLEEMPSILEKENDLIVKDLVPPTKPELKAAIKFLHSFTSLSSKSSGGLQGAPHDFLSMEQSPFSLPSGSETGTLLHLLLEKIPFYEARLWHTPADAEPLVRPFLQETLFEKWSETISAIVFYALKTPLKPGFALQDVAPERISCEAEFLFPSAISTAPGYVKGFIDLMFEHKGLYYLLDWKSNWLGAAAGDYSLEHLTQAMRESEYDLQARIYTHSLKQYLSILSSKPFEELFGGVFYIFLRGLPEQGILHFFPEDL